MATTEAAGRRRRWGRGLLVALAVIVLLPVIGAAAFLARFDPDKYRPDIEQAVRRVTGRAFAIGSVQVKLSLWPTLIARDVTLANPPGFSRPEMLRIRRIEGELALPALLAGELRIGRLVLDKPDLMLERAADGSENWTFAAAARQSAAGGTIASAPGARPLRVSIEAVSVTHGRIALRRLGGDGAAIDTLAIGRLDAGAPNADAPIRFSGALSIDDTPVAVEGELGPLSQLQAAPFRGPWPAQFNIDNGVMTIAATLSRPAGTTDVEIAFSAAASDLSKVPIGPVGLRGLRDVRLAATVRDEPGGALVRDVTAHVGASDFGAAAPDLNLTSIDLAAPDFDHLATLRTAATINGVPVSAAGTTGPVRAVWPGAAPAPIAVDVTIEAAGTTATVAGKIAHPATGGGADLAVTSHAPDLSALGPLVHSSLPALHEVTASAQLTTPDGGPSSGFTATNMKITTEAGDVGGRIAFDIAGKPRLTADLDATTIDADRVRMAMAAEPRKSPTAAEAPPPADKAGRCAGLDARLVRVAETGHSGYPLPFDTLNRADGDVTLHIAEMKLDGTTYRALVAHGVLTGGRLSYRSHRGDLPEGSLSARLVADASTEAAPRVEFSLRAPGLALAPLLALLSLPAEVHGNIEMDADLRGAGASPRAIAADLTGHAGLAMVNGQIDNRLLSETLAPVLKSAKLPPDLAAGAGRGHTDLRCVAARLDATNGIATLSNFLLDSPKLRVEAAGSADLTNEMLAMKLRPLVRFSLTGIAVPLDLGGTFAAPRVQIDQSAGSDPASAPTTLAGVLGGRALPELSGGDPCPAALAAGRLGRAGPMPSVAAAAAPEGSTAPAAAKPPKAIDILKQLLR